MRNSMVVASTAETDRIGKDEVPAKSQMLKWLYWISTLYIAVTMLLVGATAILHAPPFFNEFRRLGYPDYFSTLLGAWKVLGAVALLTPGYPLVKEWAYAGFFIDFTGALAAYAAVGGGAEKFSGPLLATLALIVSWYLRPPSRRLVPQM